MAVPAPASTRLTKNVINIILNFILLLNNHVIPKSRNKPHPNTKANKIITKPIILKPFKVRIIDTTKVKTKAIKAHDKPIITNTNINLIQKLNIAPRILNKI